MSLSLVALLPWGAPATVPRARAGGPGSAAGATRGWMSQVDPSSVPDEALVERLGRGDAGALRALIDRHRGPLHGYLARLLASSDDADDIFQEAWVRVLRHAARFDPARPFRPWLYSIATNLVRNAWRARSYRDAVSLDPADDGHDDGPSLADALAGRSVAPLEEAARGETAGAVRAAVAELPEKGRVALVLFYYQGLSYEEIGQTLDVPLGTVKSRIHNAVARLARTLGQEEGS
jgi:RNA polymerase sigma-70 factor (ECF subfamily)